MPKTAITAATVAKAKAAAVPGATQSEITDARAEGLCIRIGARGARWGLRFQLAGKQTRLDLGGIDDWSIAEARDIAAEAQRVMRGGLQRPDADWVHQQRIRLGKVEAPETPQSDPRLSLKWSWEDGDAARARRSASRAVSSAGPARSHAPDEEWQLDHFAVDD